MPIINAAIKTQVNALIEQTKALEQAQSQDAFAQGLADIIETALKSATVNVLPGIPVTTNTGAGATVGPGTGNLT